MADVMSFDRDGLGPPSSEVLVSTSVEQQDLRLAQRSAPEAQPAYDLIELFFFAYRDFVSDPDRLLGEFGFGRAHHRVLHFVSRRPGLSVADLLDVLKITKQSLNRVLKELVDKGYVESRTGTSDRRQRLLYASEAGQALAARLARLQTRRLNRALREVPGDEATATIREFLFAMIDENEREKVRGIVGDAMLRP